MSSMVIWMLGIAGSVSLLVLTAALNLFYLHMIVAALVSVLVALAAFREVRLDGSNLSEVTQRTSYLLRHMGLVLAWAALGIFATYAFKILTWREWLQFFIALMVLAGLTLFLAATLRKDAEAGIGDATMVKVARGYAMVMFGAMVITMLGLVIDGKLWRFTTVAGMRPNSQDWAANNIFFFGALSMAALAWNTIKTLKRT